MNPASGILRYLADCYRESGSRTGITSLESSRVRQSVFVEGEDPLLSTSVIDGRQFLRGKKAANLANQARLHSKDRDLYYGSAFLIGRIEGERRRTAFAPLFLYSATVEAVHDETAAEFAIDIGRWVLNYALLEHFADDEFLEKIEHAIEGSGPTEGGIGEIRRLFANQFDEASTELLLNYPKLLSERELSSYFTSIGTSESEVIHLVPGGVFFLADKSTEMRGVLNDLAAMADDEKPPSTAVAELLGPKVMSDGWLPPKPAKKGHIPVWLSEAQEKVAASARERALTLAVGPPGTGKSFTIAALAIEAMSRGESVLIASKMDHAVDVVADKIEDTLGLPGVCVRGGRSSYLRDLKKFLEDLLSGLHTRDGILPKNVKAARTALLKFRRTVSDLESSLANRCAKEERRGRLLSREGGFITRWRQDWLRRRGENFEELGALSESIERQMEELCRETVAFLELNRRFDLQRALAKHRATFQSFSKGIRARSSYKQDEYFEGVQWKALLGALPVWLVNLSDLHRIIPLQREMFDLVIIDEASQCDIASALPALQRAKRAVVTGDPKQLRHVSFLPVSRQREFAEQNGLDESEAERFGFRSVSLVDLASDAIADQNAVVFLDEHFRSRPRIIGFSNREFYADRLAIMTGHREVDRHEGSAISIHKVNGKRSESGVNTDEIDAVFSELETLTAADASPLSIGILSPFRAQVDAIMKRAEKSGRLAHWLDHHDLLVGTAHSFQGEERDIMLLSFALDDASPHASFRFLDKDDVFNVAITRARLQNRLFVSFDFEESPERLASRFLRYASAEKEPASKTDRGESSTRPCSVDVLNALEALGFEVEQGFRIGGYLIDILCRKDGVSIGIDLIGFPGRFREAMGMSRHLMLRRAGIRLFPVSLLEWEIRRDVVLERFSRWMNDGRYASLKNR